MYKPSKEEFKAVMKRKGWSNLALGERWDMSQTWVSKIINNNSRPQHWNDALAGLPDKNEL